MTAEEFYKDHFSNLTIDLDVEKFIEVTLLDIEQYANQRVIEELEKLKGLGVTYTDDVIDKRIKELKQ
jgi:hypothetical protein